MPKFSNKLRTWVVRCGDDGSMLYKTVDGLAKVCRYKSKTAALRDCQSFGRGRTAYVPKFVLRAKVRAEEATLNWRRTRKHAMRVRAMEDRVAEAAARYVASRRREGVKKKST